MSEDSGGVKSASRCDVRPDLERGGWAVTTPGGQVFFFATRQEADEFATPYEYGWIESRPLANS